MEQEKRNIELYNSQVEREWGRLVRDEFHRLEYDTTHRFLKKYLPKKGSILDAGSGPGRYSVDLAKKGYKMVLVDITPGNVVAAGEKVKEYGVEKNILSIDEGNIKDLSNFKSNSFDAVICLGGPLTHVEGEKNRDKALSELLRVAKKNAPVFISVFGKNGTIMKGPMRFPEEIGITKHWRDFWKNGEDKLWNGGRGYAHYFTIEEIRQFFGKKAKIIDIVGLEGLASATKPEELEEVFRDKSIKKNWLEMHNEVCSNEEVASLSQHILIVCRKK